MDFIPAKAGIQIAKFLSIMFSNDSCRSIGEMTTLLELIIDFSL